MSRRFTPPIGRASEPSRLFDRTLLAYINAGGAAAVTAAPVTMACHFNSTSITTNQALMTITETPGTTNYIQMALAGAVGGDPIRITVSAGSASNADTTAGYLAGRWHHACAVVASSTSRTVYLDGGNSATNTTSRTPSSLARTEIGNRSTVASLSMDGRIFWPCFWNVALDPREVLALARGVPPWAVRPDRIVSFPNLHTLYDPYFRRQWTDSGSKLGDQRFVRKANISGRRRLVPVGSASSVPAMVASYRRRRVA